MVAEIDYLIVLVPYDDNTRNLIDAATFKAMKPSSYLINIARGGFNTSYPDHALPQIETNLRCFLDGKPDQMINLENR